MSEDKNQVPYKYEEMLQEFRIKLEKDPAARDRACAWLHKTIGEEAAGHLCDLSDSMKIQACIDHMKISLASGDIQIDDLKEIFG
ncbi:hypothetical protein C0581_00960 [Candidatus Parcubacteria bacterium]|nr:MAG: hypothetical protein C0581_00960 [Candidatus Parcubacteria bacterium]